MAFQLIKGIDGQRDRRGLVSVTYEVLATDMTEGEALNPQLHPAPRNPGVPEVNRRIKEHIDNRSFRVTIVCEGMVEEPKEEETQYTIEQEWREEPIELFPDRAGLISDYGAYVDANGRLQFPQFLTSDPGNLAGLPGFSAPLDSEENPLYGCTTYPVLLAVAKKSYISRTMPGGLWSRAGNVIESLPAGFTNPPSGPWFVEPPKMRKRGNCVEIIEGFKQIRNLKHIEALYRLLQK